VVALVAPYVDVKTRALVVEATSVNVKPTTLAIDDDTLPC
jgi:hypothetical protein